MFSMTPIKVPILGIVENMAYFVADELPGKKYFIFGENGGQRMADELKLKLLGQIPIYMSIREGGDNGTPAVFEKNTPVQKAFFELAENVAQSVSILNAIQKN